ncbi:MAG: hypothetical protein JXJ22_00035 [Bacteroidales bacterium]|nr:hypothetical protein [Bacteroidales bacterium]
MKLLDEVKQNIAVKKLKTKADRIIRKRKICNIYDAKSIGILYNATHPVSFELVKDMAKKFAEKKIKIAALGYVDSKEVIDHYLYRPGFTFVSKKDLNWYFLPVSDNVDEFINTPFDILINLSLDYSYPLQYINATSVASYKVGRYNTNDEYLDLMIDIEKERVKIKKDQEQKLKENADKEKPDLKLLKEEKVRQLTVFLINELLYYLSIIKY